MTRKQTPRKQLIHEFAKRYFDLNADCLLLHNRVERFKAEGRDPAIVTEAENLHRGAELQMGLLAVMAQDMGIVDEIYALRRQLEIEREQARANRFAGGVLTPDGPGRYQVKNEERIY